MGWSRFILFNQLIYANSALFVIALDIARTHNTNTAKAPTTKLPSTTKITTITAI